MKITNFSEEDFSRLSQLDKIEYLIRKNRIEDNIRKSFPKIELIFIIFIWAFSSIYGMLIFSAYGFTSESAAVVNYLSIFFNSIMIILVISLILRTYTWAIKHSQISQINEEFLDRTALTKSMEDSTPIVYEITKRKKKKWKKIKK